MMEENDDVVDELPAPPLRLFERLAQISGYTWDQSVPPFHSSYDNWHVFGIHRGALQEGAVSVNSLNSNRSSPQSNTRPPFRHRETNTSDAGSDCSAQRADEQTYIPVVARISTHILRLEREFQLCKSLVQSSDPSCNHTVRPISLVKLPSYQNYDEAYVVSVFQSPGRNYLRDLVDFGPAFWNPNLPTPGWYADQTDGESNKLSQIPVSVFLDFAIGASECLELLHHGLRVVHGELRGDAFHFNRETGAVKLLNFGSGPRSFENGLTSAGWSSISRELGAKHKLQFIAPEQTGRMPAEPDSRTDIYSLGVLFWTMLTGIPAVNGQTPIDIIQSVLGRRIAPVTSKRIDVPAVVSNIIQKMTQKQIDERYHSTSGLKHDLVQVRKILSEGDEEALATFRIGSKDVSSFFVLPTAIFGREKENEQIVKIIDTVSKQQSSIALKAFQAGSLHNQGSSSATSESRIDGLEVGEGANSDTSSLNVKSRSDSGPNLPPAFLADAKNIQQDSRNSVESTDTINTIEVTEGSEEIQQEGSYDNTNGTTNGSSHSHRTSRRSKRKGRTEVVTIIGAAGMGKSSLIQNVQQEIRKRGYFASAKFDDARRAPFEPLLRVLGSLFRQIYSESDVTTDYHEMIRRSVRFIWPLLCNMLDLPEKLLYGGHQHGTKSMSQQGLNKSLLAEMRDSSSTHSSQSSIGTSHSAAMALPKAGGSTHSLRFMSTFLDVIRILTTGKLICLCLDDLQFADEESLELISNIISGKLRIVLMTTCRKEEELPSKIKVMLGTREANVTKLQLEPLSEKDVSRYIASTLYRSEEYIFPLAAVAFEKTNGNPFYLRQLLDVCYQKNAVWYSWKTSSWEYDLDRVFAQFESEDYGQQLNTDFITRRLNDQLPSAARTILAWASLLGNTFHFSLIQKLISGEFDFVDNEGERILPACTPSVSVKLFLDEATESSVEGLQACLQAFILVPGERDDQFRFGHERYQHASQALRECQDVEKMHFIIARTLMKYHSSDEHLLYTRAGHICASVGLIKRRINFRSPFRDTLCQAASKAAISGARPTALWYYQNCIKLLQLDPWRDEGDDIYYEETLDLYTQTAELYLYQGKFSDALLMLSSTFAHARTAADKAPSWIVQSRVFANRGDSFAAFNALKTSLAELGLMFERITSWEACDAEYKVLFEQMDAMDISDFVEKPLSRDSNLIALGAVMVEAMSAAYWSDALLFYQMTIKMIDLHLHRGSFIQVGLGCGYLAMVSISRFSAISFARKLFNASNYLLRKHNDPFTLGRGLTVHGLFITHLLSPLKDHISIYEESIDYTILSGDKIVFLTAVGGLALSRLYMGADMVDLEAFCVDAPEDFGEWSEDLRGGAMVTAIRQIARAFQGKTFLNSASTVMSDNGHSTEKYMEFINARASNVERPRDIYQCLSMIPLYFFGHYEQAIKTGRRLIPSSESLWSMRCKPLTIFYLSLSLLAQLRENKIDENSQNILSEVQKYKNMIDEWQSECNVNYLMWSLLIEAEVCEITGDLHRATETYEAAIDHCQVYEFALEEALGFELQAGFFVRRGARRAARSTFDQCIAVYARVRAQAKVDQLTTKHEWLLKTATKARTADVAVQTANSIGEIGNTSYRIQENERQEVRNLGKETAGDRTAAWLNPAATKDGSLDVSRLGLDVLDLQSILEFNQAISSELQIDRLLAKMTDIILESAGAHFAGVVIESEDGVSGSSWCFAASGTQDGVSAEPLPLSEIKEETTKQVLFYTLRFRETVFVHNVLQDERFSANASSAKSIISLPIIQGENLLGVLYLEGQSHAFTSRNLGVLQLFCDQVGISISNALLFRKIQKVSAANTSMIESQKRALKTARTAEEKARVAEMEALRNVKLKEEAARAKSMFLANVSHELRTPLNGVIGMSELLKGTKLDQEQDGYADSIRVCADTLLTVINDILDFSKLEAGKMKLFSVPLNLHETITEVVRALSYTNLKSEVQTVEELDLDTKALVIGDPVRLHQILMNLLSNAYKFTSKGTVTVRSKTEYEDDRQIRVTCSVGDTGIGITQEQLSRLFMPFAQADSSTQRSYGGSGLGLSICKALIGVLDGKIWLESQLGVGTTVSFTLTFPKVGNESTSTNAPTHPNEPDPMATWSSDTTVSSSRTSDSGIVDLSEIPRDQLRICIAEDNPINQKIAISFVNKLGFQCQAFIDGMQAVEALRQKSKEGKPFHLVLMDVQMPVMDGYDATRLIRQDPDPAVRSVLIIAMTASAIRGDKERCIEAGMNNYLAKPVRAAVLKSMLEDYLSQSTKPIANLQATANRLAKKVVKNGLNGKADGTSGGGDKTPKVRPLSPPPLPDDIKSNVLSPTLPSDPPESTPTSPPCTVLPHRLAENGTPTTFNRFRKHSTNASMSKKPD